MLQALIYGAGNGGTRLYDEMALVYSSKNRSVGQKVSHGDYTYIFKDGVT